MALWHKDGGEGDDRECIAETLEPRVLFSGAPIDTPTDIPTHPEGATDQIHTQILIDSTQETVHNIHEAYEQTPISIQPHTHNTHHVHNTPNTLETSHHTQSDTSHHPQLALTQQQEIEHVKSHLSHITLFPPTHRLEAGTFTIQGLATLQDGSTYDITSYIDQIVDFDDGQLGPSNIQYLDQGVFMNYGSKQSFSGVLQVAYNTLSPDTDLPTPPAHSNTTNPIYTRTQQNITLSFASTDLQTTQELYSLTSNQALEQAYAFQPTPVKTMEVQLREGAILLTKESTQTDSIEAALRSHMGEDYEQLAYIRPKFENGVQAGSAVQIKLEGGTRSGMRFDLTDFATFHSKSFEQIDTNVFYHDGGYSYNKQGQIYMNYDYQIGRYNYDIRAQRINISMESGWERRSRELNDLRGVTHIDADLFGIQEQHNQYIAYEGDRIGFDIRGFTSRGEKNFRYADTAQIFMMPDEHGQFPQIVQKYNDNTFRFGNVTQDITVRFKITFGGKEVIKEVHVKATTNNTTINNISTTIPQQYTTTNINNITTHHTSNPQLTIEPTIELTTITDAPEGTRILRFITFVNGHLLDNSHPDMNARGELELIEGTTIHTQIFADYGEDYTLKDVTDQFDLGGDRQMAPGKLDIYAKNTRKTQDQSIMLHYVGPEKIQDTSGDRSFYINHKSMIRFQIRSYDHQVQYGGDDDNGYGKGNGSVNNTILNRDGSLQSGGTIVDGRFVEQGSNTNTTATNSNPLHTLSTTNTNTGNTSNRFTLETYLTNNTITQPTIFIETLTSITQEAHHQPDTLDTIINPQIWYIYPNTQPQNITKNITLNRTFLDGYYHYSLEHAFKVHGKDIHIITQPIEVSGLQPIHTLSTNTQSLNYFSDSEILQMNNDLISRLSNTWDTLTSSEQQSQLDLLSESITYLKARDNLTGSELTALGGQERWVQRKRIELGSTMEKNSLNQIHADQDMLTQKLHTLESKLHTWSFPTSIMRDVLMKRTQDTIVSYHSFLNAWNNTTPINDKIQLQKEFVETAHHLFHDKLLYGTSIQNELQTVLDSIIMQQWSEWITTELARTTTSTGVHPGGEVWHAVVNDVSELSYISKDNKTALIEQARLGFIEYLENDPEVMSSYQILKGVVLNKTPETMDEILALFSQNEHSLEQIDAQSWATMTDQEKKIIGYSFMQNIVLIERSDVYHHSAYSPAIQSQILRLFTTIDQLGGDVLSIFPDWHADRNIYNVDIPAHILDAVKSGWFEYGDGKDAFHQVGVDCGSNAKLGNGKFEAVYNADGTIDLSTENLGTFNLISPGNPLEDFGHAVLDVVPFILSGNDGVKISLFDVMDRLEEGKRCFNY